MLLSALFPPCEVSCEGCLNSERSGTGCLVGEPSGMLDPRVRLLLWLAKAGGRTFYPDVSVARMRSAYAEMNARFGLRDRGGVAVREVAIPAEDGYEIPARLYQPTAAGAARLPVLLYFHGGGWVIGDVASFDHLTRFFAREGGMAVLSVDYRLAPEHKFPRAHADGFAALAWLQRSGDAFGIDRARIAVGGDSAGAGIAAALSAYAVDRGLERPHFQFLIYPPVDARGRFPSRSRFIGNYPITPASIEWFARHYTNGREDRDSPLLNVLDAPHPERMPPTYLLAAAYDPLVDEGRAYADRLRAAGVRVSYDLQPTLPHALVNLAGAVPAARRALSTGIRATAAAFEATV
jgi:acetyl esterase